jgi:scyllo-inositol 2-dehydrogenase (NADP+)
MSMHQNETPIGVLGLGRMGLIHCGLVNATAGLRLVAGSSRSAARCAEARRLYSIRTYEDHEALLRDPEVAWIIIATYTHEHYRWAMQAIQAGKSLIIEKPIALSHREAAAIFRAAKCRKVQVTVHQSRRWDRDFLLVAELIREGLLGRVYRIESRYTGFSSGWAGWGAEGMDNPWRLHKQAGGMLNDWGTHLFDQLLLLARSPVRNLFARLEARVWSREADDHFWAELVFAGGLTARVEASNNFRLPLPRWLLLGERGSLEVQGGEPDQWNVAVLRHDPGAGPAPGDLVERRYEIPHPELAEGFFPALATALGSGKALPVSPGDVLAAMRLVDAVRRSSRQGRSVRP